MSSGHCWFFRLSSPYCVRFALIDMRVTNDISPARQAPYANKRWRHRDDVRLTVANQKFTRNGHLLMSRCACVGYCDCFAVASFSECRSSHLADDRVFPFKVSRLSCSVCIDCNISTMPLLLCRLTIPFWFLILNVNEILYYQNLRNKDWLIDWLIERHPYTKSRIGQIPCVCMYVCMYMCVTTLPNPLNRFAYKLYQQIERLTLIAIGYLDLKYLPPPYLKPPKKPQNGVNRHFQAKLA